MKTVWKKLILGVVVIVLAVAAACAALTGYYQKGYMVNTWINGVYATGKTMQEMESILMDQIEIPEYIMITAYDGVGMNAKPQEYELSLHEIGFACDYQAEIQNCLFEQRNSSWVSSLFSPSVYNISPQRRYEEELLKQWWDQTIPSSEAAAEYKISYADEIGYFLSDSMYHRLESEKAYSLLQQAVLSGEESLDLISSGCYYDAEFSQEQKDEAKLWENINLFQTNGPVYDFTDEQPELSAGEMAAFLMKDADTHRPLLDKDGNFMIDDDYLTQWLKQLAEAYDTYQREWSFRATSGKTVSVKGVTYGTTMNQKRELVWLKEYFHALAALKTIDGDPVVRENMPNRIHVAEYTRDAFTHSGKSIGSTYIEVDMGLQKLYYYVNGELKLESDTVTGNMQRRYSTPEGVNFVYNKQQNRLLRGQGYTSPVKFWMPVKGAVGIHDATWRDEFGGDIYLTNGSHGCVNIPVEKAEELYEMVEIGTPVVMFYGEDNN